MGQVILDTYPVGEPSQAAGKGLNISVSLADLTDTLLVRLRHVDHFFDPGNGKQGIIECRRINGFRQECIHSGLTSTFLDRTPVISGNNDDCRIRAYNISHSRITL